MFGRKPQGPTIPNPESSSAPSGDQLLNRHTIPAKEIGHTGLLDNLAVVPIDSVTPNTVVEAKKDVPDSEMVQEAAKQAREIDASYEKILRNAASNGTSLTDMRKSIIDGWNAGTLPRAVVSSITRGSGIRMQMLQNEVPEDFFEVCGNGAEIVMPGQVTPSGSERPVQLRLKSLPVDWDRPEEPGPYEKPDPTNPSTFYVETFMYPQIPGDTRFSAADTGARLAEVNATLLPPAVS